MVKSSLTALSAKILATTLSVSVAVVGVPVNALAASLSGNVYSSSDEAPLIGVTVYAAQPETGRIFAAEPSSAKGSFSIAELPAGKFELGVAIDQGLFLVEKPLSLAAAESQHVNIAVDTRALATDGQATSGAAVAPQTAKPGVWNNPLTAALIVVGAAIVIGLLVEAATDDDDSASAF